MGPSPGEVAMPRRSVTVLVGLVSAVVATAAITISLREHHSPVVEEPFPLRTDPLPKGWKAEAINEGLPYRWEKGTVHVLAWETIEDDRPWRYTQVLVLKRFDRPTEKGGHRWVLAQVYHHPDDAEWPWQGPMRVPPPWPMREQRPRLTDAQVFGHEFYNDPPSYDQVKTFLRETMWTPTLGTGERTSLFFGNRGVTTKLAAGGVDPTLWKWLLNSDVPTDLFPELKK
jgi:hypothetical protein